MFVELQLEQMRYQVSWQTAKSLTCAKLWLHNLSLINTIPSFFSVPDGPNQAPDLVGSSPEVSDSQPSTSGRSSPPSSSSPPPPPPSSPGFSFKRLIRPLANLKLAIGELIVIAALSSIGTVIEQNKPEAFYVQNYPSEGPKVLGFVTHDLINFLQWDHIYTANYFLAILALLAASLSACTATTQWPAVKVAQRWRFRKDEKAYKGLDIARKVPSARIMDLAQELQAKNYQMFVQDGALYGFKGLGGKLGPIGVHASMLAVMAGIVVGSVGGFSGSVMIPEGGDSLVASSLRPFSPIAQLPAGGEAVIKVNDFSIDYRSDGSVRQFLTGVVVEDLNGNKIAEKTMSVNQPLRFGGVTAYQTDWSMAALTIRAPGSPLSPPGGEALNLPMASLEGKANTSGKLYAAFLPLADPNEAQREGKAPKGISFLARDLQSVVIYDSKGTFIGVRRPGSGKPLNVEGVDIVVERIVAASGMEMKVDPGVPLVYAGFGGMCITTVLSYLSHSQVWAAQVGGDIVVGGRTNRAKVGFQQELEDLVDRLPEASS
jgi:cytochrome c biogenesis protein